MPAELPHAFLSALSEFPGMQVNAFRSALSDAPPVSIRINPAKKIDPLIHFNLLQPENVPWTDHGFYLNDRPSFTLDPLFHAGAYYVQEAGSMFLEQAIKKVLEDIDVKHTLDLCAAPGGKSTHLHSLLPSDSLIISNEVIKQRQHILMENWVKWGAKNAIVTGSDPKDFQRLSSWFDLIVVDAPCSGSGMFRKDPESISHWSPAHVEHCAQRQERILQDVLPALRPGGYLVYSTCSYSEAENEEVLDFMLSEFPLESIQIPFNPKWGIQETHSKNKQGFGYRCYPHLCRGEGFFLTLLKKKDEFDSKQDYSYSKPKSKQEPSTKLQKQNDFSEWIHLNPGEVLIDWKGQLLLMNQTMAENLSEVQQNLYIRSAGVHVGSAGSKGFIPEHGLVMSGNLPSTFPRFEIDKQDALQLLRHQSLSVTIDHKGWILLTHEGQALSLVKSLPNRINNYYPREWRILNK